MKQLHSLALRCSFLLPSLTGFCGETNAQGQGNLVDHVGSFDPGERGNDVWGYSSPGGTELAILGTVNGTWFVDVTQPDQPTSVGFVRGPNSTWRDMKTFGNHAYIVTEGGGGMQIVDLSVPTQPTFLGTWGGSLWRNAHNLFIDVPAGIAYVCGTNRGLVVLDLRQDPANPTFVRDWNDAYVHDLHVQNGLAHLACINVGQYWIVDVSQLPSMTVLSRTQTPRRFTHNVGVNANDSIAVTTDEVTGGHLAFYDIADPTAPVPLGEYVANPQAIVHNVFVLGEYAHVAYYTEGYRIVDMHDPSQPVEAGFYDTYPGTSGGFEGQWGCYPYGPNGLVYVSDRTTGLHVLRPRPLRVTHAELPDTTDEDSTVSVALGVQAGAGTSVLSVDVDWRVGTSGGTQSVPMTATMPGAYEGSLPAQRAVRRVQYAFRVTTSNGVQRWPADPARFFDYVVGRAAVFHREDFENGWNGWTHSATFGTDDWELGSPAGRAGDAPSAFSGTACIGTDLGNGTDGEYARSSTTRVLSPSIPTGGRRDVKLRYRRWLTLDDGDQAVIFAQNLPAWGTQTNRPFADVTWTEHVVDLPILNFHTQAVLGFSLTSDATDQKGGWNIDHVELFHFTDCLGDLHYGTASAGTGGILPELGSLDDPYVGNANFALEVRALRGGTPYVLLLAAGSLNLPLGGVNLWVDPATAITLPGIAGGTPGLGGAGSGLHSFPLPNDPTWDDADVFAQVLALDPGASAGLAASSGVRVRVCSIAP